MEKERTVEIPSHWFNKVIGIYPFREGIWMNESTEPIVRVINVFIGLSEVSGVKAEFNYCYEYFLREFAPALVRLAKSQIDKREIPSLRQVEATIPFAESDWEHLINIFEPWVDKWAVGSEVMLKCVVAYSALEALILQLGLKREVLRKPDGLPTRKLLDFAGLFDPKLAPYWKILLSGEYHRGVKTARELARRTVQVSGFYRRRELQLLTHAHCWIAVRSLGYTNIAVMQLMALSDAEAKYQTEDNFSSKVLAPFDKALKIKPKLGRPWSKQLFHQEIMEKIFKNLLKTP